MSKQISPFQASHHTLRILDNEQFEIAHEYGLAAFGDINTFTANIRIDLEDLTAEFPTVALICWKARDAFANEGVYEAAQEFARERGIEFVCPLG